LRSALSTAVRWRLPSPQPGRRRRAAFGAPNRDDGVAPRQLHAFLQAAGDPLVRLYALIAATGLRRGEAVALRWADVDRRG
jgi:integrase